MVVTFVPFFGPTETMPRVATDDSSYSQPPLLDEPTTSGLHLHPPSPPLPITDSSAVKKKLPPLKPVKIRITPCLVKQRPSQQPLFESTVSHQSDVGSEATITYESDSGQYSAYKLRDRKSQPFSSFSSSESEDLLKDSVIKHSTKVRKSPRQKATQRRKVNSIKESVYKDPSSSEIEDLESMETVSGGAADRTELSDNANLSQSGSKKQSKSVSVGGTPTKIQKSARLRDLESGFRRMLPKKLHISSESESLRKFKSTALELRRSERKRDLDKATSSPYKRDDSSESESLRKFKATALELRKSERKRDLDKRDVQTSSSCTRESSLESESSRNLRATEIELRRSERKRDLDKATCLPHKRDSSLEPESSRKFRATEIELRSERKQDLDKRDFQVSSRHKRDSSLDSENSRKSRTTAVELRRNDRKQDLDKATSSPHKRNSSSESESTKKSKATAVELRRSERKRDLTSSPHKRDGFSVSETMRKSGATAVKLKSSKEKRDSDKVGFRACSPHKKDSSSESENTKKSKATAAELRRSEGKQDLTSSPHKRDSFSVSETTRKSGATAVKLKSSKEKHDSDKVGFRAHSPHNRDSSSELESSTEEESVLRQNKRTNHTKGDLKTTSPKKKQSLASHTEYDSESENAVGTHHQYILRQQEMDIPVERSSHYLRSQTEPSNPIVSEQKSKCQSSEADQSGTVRDMEKEGSLSKKGQLSSNTAFCANMWQKIISSKTDHNDLGDGTDATSHDTTEAKKLLTKHSTAIASDPKGKRSQDSSLPSSKQSDKATSLATTKSDVESSEGLPSKTTSVSTSAVVHGDSRVVTKNTAIAGISGLRLRSHPGNKPSATTASTQLSIARNSPSAMSGKATEGHHAHPEDLTSKQNQREEAVQRKSTPTMKLVDNQRVRERRKDDNSGPSSAKENENQSFSPRKSEHDRRNRKRIKSIIESLVCDGDFSVRRSPRQHTSSLTKDPRVRQQGDKSSPATERKSKQLAHAKDSSLFSQCQATVQSTHKRDTHTVITDLATNTRTVSSNQRSPVKARKPSIKVLSPGEARASLSSSMPRDFKRPKKQLKFSLNDSGGESDSSTRNTVKRVRFATSLDNEELSETDKVLLTVTSESHQEQESPSKNPAVDGTSNIETSSTGGSLQLASEITVSSDASDSAQPPSLLSRSASSNRKKRSSTKTKEIPQTPPTQLSQRGDEGVMLPSPPLWTQTGLCCDDTDATQNGGSSGIQTVLSQVSQLRRRGKPRKNNKRRNTQQNKARSKTVSRTAALPSKGASAPSVQSSANETSNSLQMNKEGTTSSDSTNGATAHENTRKRKRPRKAESSDKDESATKPPNPKKQKKEGHTSDICVPPASNGHCHGSSERDSASNSRSPSTGSLKKRGKSRKAESSGKDESATKPPNPKKECHASDICVPPASNGNERDSASNSRTPTTGSLKKRGKSRKTESSDKDESATMPLNPKKQTKECHASDICVPPASNGSERDSASNSRSPTTGSLKKKRKSRKTESSDKDESATKPPNPKKQKKECHVSDICVPPASNGSERDSASNSRSPSTRLPKKRGRSRKTESSDKDESANKPSNPKKRKKECHTSDVCVPPASNRHRHGSNERDSASNSRSPVRKARQHQSSGGGRGAKSSNKENHSSSGDTGAKGSDKESHSSGGNGGANHSSGGSRGAGDGDRGGISANYGNQSKEHCASTSRGTAIGGYCGNRESALSVGNPSTTLLTHQGFPDIHVSTHTRDTGPSYGDTNTQCHVFPGTFNNIEHQVSSQVDEMVQSPEIDVVGFTPEYSEPVEATPDDIMDSQGQGHTHSTPGYQLTSSNDDRVIVTNPPYPSSSGQPHTNVSNNCNQSTPSNTDRLISTYPPYPSNSGRPHSNLPNNHYNQSTLSNTDRLISTYPPYPSNSGRPRSNLPNNHYNQSTPSNTNRLISTHPPYTTSSRNLHTNLSVCNQSTSSNTNRLISTHPPYTTNSRHLHTNLSVCNQSTSSNTDRLISTHPPYTSNNGRPHTNYSNYSPSTPSKTDRLVYTHPPYASSDGSALSRYYHEDSPGNSPVIGLMNHSQVLHNIRMMMPNSLKQQQPLSPRSANVGAYPQDEMSGHRQLNLIGDNSRGNSPEIGLMNHLPLIKTMTPYSSRQRQQQSLGSASIGAYPRDETSGHEQLNLIDDEYELSQVQSQYYHAPVQRLAQQIPNYSDSESIVSESAVSSNGTPVP